MIGGVRCLLAAASSRSYEQQGGLSDNLLALVLAVALVSALSDGSVGSALAVWRLRRRSRDAKRSSRFVAYLTEKFESSDNPSVAASILRVYGTKNPDWPGARRGDVALLRSHHRHSSDRER